MNCNKLWLFSTVLDLGHLRPVKAVGTGVGENEYEHAGPGCAAKARAQAEFGLKAAVVGVGITRIDGGYGVQVNLGAPPEPDADLPETIDGVPVRVEVVGPIRKR